MLAASKEILTEEQAIGVSFAGAKSLSLERNQDGTISKSRFVNYCEVLEGDAYLSGRLRMNLLDGRVEATGFFWNAEKHPVRDDDIANMRRFLDGVFELNNEKNIRQAVWIAAGKNAYHPVREMLKSLQWDGVSRIPDLFPRFLGAERSDYTTAVTKLLLSGAIQRIYRPGVKFDYCIILADTQQGTGKSTLCRALALDDEWFTDQVGDLSDNKKAFESIRGKWIVELGELLAVRKTKDVEAIKAFITRQSDFYRNPYGIYPEDYKRQCVFIGTTNKPQFLPEDRTGNRRFIPLRCNGSRQEVHPMQDFEATREYIRQCYAEIIASGVYDLTLDRKYQEELEAIQEQSTPDDTRVGMIQALLDRTNEQYVCARMIWDRVFSGKNEKPPQSYDLRDIADIMNLQIVGWKPYKGKSGAVKDAKYSFEGYGRQRAWMKLTETRPEGRPDTRPDTRPEGIYSDGFTDFDGDFASL